MRIEANAIKVRNIVFAVVCGILVPVARVLSRHAAMVADTAAWLSPFVAGLLFLPYAAILIRLLKNYPGKNLMAINREIFGQRIGRLVNLVYSLWFLLLTGYYLCQYGERMSATVFYNTDRAIFVTAMLFLVSFCLTFGQENILRASSFFLFAVVAVFLSSLLFLTPNIHLEYHLPVTLDHFPGIVTGGFQIFSVLTYFITVPVFFGEVNSEKAGRQLVMGGLLTLSLCLVSIFVVIGVFSAPLATSMPFPYFSAIKEIRLFQSVERIEAMIFAVLMISDFMILILFTLCLGKCAQDTFRLKQPIRFDLFLMATFVVSLFFSLKADQLNEISHRLIIPVNLAIGAGLPLLTGLTALVRHLLSRRQKALLQA